MVRNSYEDLESRRFFVNIVEGFVVIIIWFILLLREFLDPSIPFSFYVVEGPVDFFLDLSLFAGVVVLLLSFSFVLVDSSIGRRRGGW